MIFLDMDGPFADFHAGYRAISGGADPPPMHGRSKLEEKAMWDRIYAKEDFFASLPVVDGAIDFYRWLVTHLGHVKHAFLTACPPSNYHDVAWQKKLWVRGTLAPHQPLVIPAMGSKAKPAHIQNPGDVLIDDSKENCEDWERYGGKAIHFTGDWNFVKEQLLEHYNLV